MIRVLLVEDHHAIATGLKDNLEIEGYEVRIASDGVAGIQLAHGWEPHLVVLDLMLPKRDGFEVLATIRARGAELPVLVLSARGSEAEKVRALKAGADDYVVKPFGLLELLARIQGLLRRPSGKLAAEDRPERYRFDDVNIDVATRSVTRAGTAVSLRPKEIDLLIALCRARGAVVSRGDLLSRVWGYDPAVVTRTVDTHVAALRQRLEPNPDHPRLILTVWKAGYRVALTQEVGPS